MFRSLANIFVVAAFIASSGWAYEVEAGKSAAHLKADKVSARGAELLKKTKTSLSRPSGRGLSQVRASVRKLAAGQKRELKVVGSALASGQTNAALAKLRSLAAGLSSRQRRSISGEILVAAAFEEAKMVSAKRLTVGMEAVKRGNAELERAIRLASRQSAKEKLKEAERQMATRGDDAQMRQLQLQGALQKHTKLIQAFSNIMKSWNDAIKSIISNIK